MEQKGNVYHSAKMIFLLAWTALLLVWIAYDYRQAGEVPLGGVILLIFTAVIAFIFQPWKPGSDEGSAS